MSEIRVTDIKGEDGSAAVNFSKGINVSSGVVTATTFVGNLTGNPTGSGANLTNLPAANLTGTLPAISGANLTGISGGIGAVGQGTLTTASQLANTASDIDIGLHVTITPTKASSKILVMASVSSGSAGGTSAGYVFKLYRSIASGTNTLIDAAGGDAAGNRSRGFLSGGQEQGADWASETSANNYLDTPSYSLGQTVKYLIYAGGAGTNQRVLNRNWRDDNTTDNPRFMSSITAIEILQ